MQHVFRVSEITRALKDVVEGQFPFVWVRGQVSNLARPASGHVYFSLKDEEALLNVVWFKGSRLGRQLAAGERYDPLTGEVLADGGDSAWLADGLEVLCAGRLTVYPPRGTYQLVAELVQDMGQGRLALEFEALKRELAAKGYFDQDRKQRLPENPTRVAVVTAPTGAAIRDFLRVGSARGTGCEIRLHPVLVQGDAAPEQIARAVEAAGTDGWAQVVVLIRGGGSLEDLWAFNTRAVADAVFACPVPVVCGVGHEVDVTIADLVADLRAATPSHAAQLLWPDRAELARRVDEAAARLDQSFERFLRATGERLSGLEKALTWLSPRAALARLDERLETLSARLRRAGGELWQAPAQRVDALEARLGGALRLVLAGRESRLEGLAPRLGAAGRAALDRAEARLELLRTRLEALDPRAPLARGYALARKADGTYLRRVADVAPGEDLDVLLQDGVVRTQVRSTSGETA